MTAAAKDRILHDEKTGKILLAQAGRDLLLSLRKEIDAMLGRMLVLDIRQALTPAELCTILSEMIKNYSRKESSDITVILNRDDLEVLEKNCLHKLREETKKTIILTPSEEISGGFAISFDSGKSRYDFSDRALAEYISTYLKPKLHDILNDAIQD